MVQLSISRAGGRVFSARGPFFPPSAHLCARARSPLVARADDDARRRRRRLQFTPTMVKEGAEEGAWWPCVDASGLVEHWWLPSRYTLRSVVGRGTYGVCAKVWCAETDTVYVVKRVQLLVPRREMKMTGRLASWAVIALRRTLREVAVLRRLREQP